MRLERRAIVYRPLKLRVGTMAFQLGRLVFNGSAAIESTRAVLRAHASSVFFRCLGTLSSDDNVIGHLLLKDGWCEPDLNDGGLSIE